MKGQVNYRNRKQAKQTLAKSWRQESKMEVEKAIHCLQWFLKIPDHSKLIQAQRHISGAIRITGHANDLSGDSLENYMGGGD